MSQKEYDFYIVPTPIGNISDITVRAMEVLKSVDLIACEDSRVTQKLLNHYDIKTKLISYHKYNERSRVEFLLGFINDGKKLALVSDAGTPMICDPGSLLLKELIKNKISYTSLPGASALTTFLSLTPRDDEFFTFVGFMPRGKSQMIEILNSYANSNIVFYESPNRIIKTLEAIKEIKGNVNVALARELTNLFEEAVIDNIDNVINHFKDGIKGEIVCMIYKTVENSDFNIVESATKLKNNGYKSKEISKILSLLSDFSKNEIYDICSNL